MHRQICFRTAHKHRRWQALAAIRLKVATRSNSRPSTDSDRTPGMCGLELLAHAKRTIGGRWNLLLFWGWDFSGNLHWGRWSWWFARWHARSSTAPTQLFSQLRASAPIKRALLPRFSFCFSEESRWNVDDSPPHRLARKLITLSPYFARVEPKFVHCPSLVPPRVLLVWSWPLRSCRETAPRSPVDRQTGQVAVVTGCI